MVLGQKNKSGLFDEEREMALLYRPADIAFGAKGEIYVADGYGNSRVVKFDKNGDFLKSWGEKGTAEGQFDNPHNIIVDAQERVYVADRHNNRVQIFDAEGKFLKAWTHLGKPWGLALAKDQSIFLTDGTNEQIYHVNTDGKILGIYGAAGQQKGKFRAVHGIALDAKNNIYVTEVLNWRVQRLQWKE